MLVQLRQLRGQAEQAAPSKYWPGRQDWQLVAVVWQVMQDGSHRRQEEPERKEPSMQAEQAVGLLGEQNEHPGAQTKQVAEPESKVYPLLQAVHEPEAHALQPGVHNFTLPSTTTCADPTTATALLEVEEPTICHSYTAAKLVLGADCVSTKSEPLLTTRMRVRCQAVS